MKEILLEVKDGFYETNLYLHLLSLKKQFNNSKELNALISLSKIQPNEISSNCELDGYLNLIEDSQFLYLSANKEISAKWKDYLFNKVSENKKDNIKEAFVLYKDVYEETKNYSYLIRALNLVRKAKGVFEDQLKGIYEYSKNEFIICNSSFQQSQLIREIYSINSEKIIDDFQVVITNKIKLKLGQNKYNSARLLIDCLKFIKAIDNNQCKIDRAESYELEGDFHAKDKEQNTYYPRILDSYTKGLKELKSINFSQELKTRLEKKIKNEQLEYSNVLKVSGFSNENFGDDIDTYISKNEINSFKKAFSELILFDVVSVENINKNN
ncbi:hypothetical protein [Flavobacterium hibisci]|uniref:hypothetical protein n=1 Tax=Flavobacterium hibisci TaxID=1914462 RepID=UPI001CBF9206|nr:hypothetical protein [Flavobacterium hibisci]MBZ4044657.1 hypothetical protein [Flavobacterium hibisci]